MDYPFVNHDLERAAKRTLTLFTGSEDSLKPLYSQPDRALFLAEHLQVVLKVYMAGNALQHEYEIAQKAASIGIPIPTIIGFEAGQPAVFAMKQVLGYPLSSHHKSAATEKVLAFLDFADAQPGDPLWDIAVVTLWDTGLTDLLLEAYNSIEKNEETKQLISLYRLLRHLTEIPWLLDRGFNKFAERNITAINDSLNEER